MIFCNCEYVNTVACQSFAQSWTLTNVSIMCVTLNFEAEVLKICVSVRIAIGKIHLIIIINEVIVPR